MQSVGFGAGLAPYDGRLLRSGRRARRAGGGMAYCHAGLLLRVVNVWRLLEPVPKLIVHGPETDRALYMFVAERGGLLVSQSVSNAVSPGFLMLLCPRVRDYERLLHHHEAMVRWSMIRIVSKRLTNRFRNRLSLPRTGGCLYRHHAVNSPDTDTGDQKQAHAADNHDWAHPTGSYPT